MSQHHDIRQPANAEDNADVFQLLNLAKSMIELFFQSGRTSILRLQFPFFVKALSYSLRHATDDQSRILSNLGGALNEKFDRFGQLKDLDEAISLHHEALDLRPTAHPDRSISLNNLAIALYTRFKQLGRGEDLDKAILLHRSALDLRAVSHPDRSITLDNLAVTLSTQFNRSGRHEDLDEVITFHREALHYVLYLPLVDLAP